MDCFDHKESENFEEDLMETSGNRTEPTGRSRVRDRYDILN